MDFELTPEQQAIRDTCRDRATVDLDIRLGDTQSKRDQLPSLLLAAGNSSRQAGGTLHWRDRPQAADVRNGRIVDPGVL